MKHSQSEKLSLEKNIDNWNEETFVEKSKILETLNILKQVNDNKSNEQKKQLFNEQNDFVFLQITLKKITSNISTYIHHIELPCHWRHELNFETCLIVKDVNKEPLKDRDTDLEQTKDYYRNLLESKNASFLINEILPIRQFKNEFSLPALKQKLSGEYDVFLCDKKLMKTKHDFLSRFLGKIFWVDGKKVPLLVSFKDPHLKEQLERKLNQTSLYESGKGSTLSVCLGSLNQKSNNLLKNSLTVLLKIKQLFGSNIRDLALKTEKSMSILFYVDLGSANEINLSKSNNFENQFIEDEFDFFQNSNVRVFQNGSVKVLKRSSTNDDNETESSEQQMLIKKINYQPNEEHWHRRMVNKFPTKKSSFKNISQI